MVRVADGGGDNLGNLKALCSACHKAAHRVRAQVSAERQAWRDYLAKLRGEGGI